MEVAVVAAVAVAVAAAADVAAAVVAAVIAILKPAVVTFSSMKGMDCSTSGMYGTAANQVQPVVAITICIATVVDVAAGTTANQVRLP